MNRVLRIREIRNKLQCGLTSLGSWMQLSDAAVAEIIGDAGYDWVAVDLEHGSIDTSDLPNINRALELGGTLPLVRLATGSVKDCKAALDSGAGGVIVPMIESYEQLTEVRDFCCWPPAGKRGVGYSRANLYGKRFADYAAEAEAPILVAMIESVNALEHLDQILEVKGLDAIFIGPYDLSASLGITGMFEDERFSNALLTIKQKCNAASMPLGIHVVEPNSTELLRRQAEGYQFIAYSLDARFMITACENPIA